jgi:hypothetical protein
MALTFIAFTRDDSSKFQMGVGTMIRFFLLMPLCITLSACAGADSHCARMVGNWKVQGAQENLQVGQAGTIQINQDAQSYVIHVGGQVPITFVGRCEDGRLAIDSRVGAISYLQSSDEVVFFGATYHRQ